MKAGYSEIIEELNSLRDKILLTPFLKIFVSIVIGTLVASEFSADISLYTFIALSTIVIVSISTKIKLPYTILILFGGSLAYLQSSENPIPYNKFVNAEIVAVKELDFGKWIIEVDKIEGNEIAPINVFFTYEDDMHATLNKGDRVKLTLMFELVEGTFKPSLRDIKELGIETYARTTCDSIPIKLSTDNYPETTKSISRRTIIKNLRDSISSRLNTLNVSEDELSIVKGISIGDKRDISFETRERYTIAGLSHILAISGLHIGIVALLLNLLLLPFTAYKYRKYKIIVIILLIWAYVFIVGGSPSSYRAALMFSIAQFGFSYKKTKYLILNILFATATLFVLFDYEILYDISFQLSFSSLLAILLISDKMEKVVCTGNFILDKCVEALLITIAIQLIITPLSLYYFGTTSIIGIIINPIATFLLPVLLTGALTYLILPNPISNMITERSMEVYTFLVDKSYSMPLNSISDGYIFFWDILIYYVILFAIYMYFSTFYKIEKRE